MTLTCDVFPNYTSIPSKIDKHIMFWQIQQHTDLW